MDLCGQIVVFVVGYFLIKVVLECTYSGICEIFAKNETGSDGFGVLEAMNVLLEPKIV